MFCVRCGTALPDRAAFCPSCGNHVAGGAGAPPEGGTPGPAPPPVAAESPAVAGAGTEAPRYAGMPPGHAGPPTPVVVVQPVAAPRYGGFWRRFCAYFLDGLILNIVMLPVGLMTGVSWVGLFASQEDITPEWFASYMGSLLTLALFGMVVNWLYAALLQSSSRQGTLGQMALGLRVTDLEGRRVSFARATGRYFAVIVTGLTFAIGYLIMLFTEKRQTLHDLIAGTVVVH